MVEKCEMELVTEIMNEFRDEEFRKSLATANYVIVRFTKRDGTERTMKCTTNPKLVVPYESKTGHVKPKPPGVVAVWELDLQEWRSIRLDTIIEWHANYEMI